MIFLLIATCSADGANGFLNAMPMELQNGEHKHSRKDFVGNNEWATLQPSAQLRAAALASTLRAGEKTRPRHTTDSSSPDIGGL